MCASMTLGAIPAGVLPLAGATKPAGARVEVRRKATPGPPGWGLDTSKRVHQDISALGEDGPPPEGFMMQGGESRKHTETTLPNTILSTRATTTIGTWNVRTMLEAGKTTQVAAEMKKYSLTILGISEARWTGSGQKRFATGELLLYSATKREMHTMHRESL